MNHKFILKPTILILLFANSIIAQVQTTKYKSNLPNGLNWNAIQTEYFKLLNELRVQQKTTQFSNDAILNLASFDQAHYMDSVHKVMHDQKLKGKESPQKRVFYYNGTHDQVGENCLSIVYNKPMKVKYSKVPIVVKTDKEVANALFLSWKNSPGHYKNMIEPAYDVAGLGFYYNADSSQIYATQVFSAKPFVPRKGLNSPDDAYGIKEGISSACNCMNTSAWNNLVKEMQIVQGVDSIYLKCEKLDLLKSFFNNANDAIYLDYVLREQFVCEKNNLLHGSPIYDGFMTKPVLIKNLLKLNKAPGNNFYAAIGPVPKEVNNLKYGLNYGIVKNGYLCDYNYVNSIPGENLNVLNLVPKWIDNQDLEVKQDTFAGVLKFNIPFERGKSTIAKASKDQLIKRLSVYKPFVKDLKIKTFSSVEGNTQANLRLQEERAKYLKDIIASVCTTQLSTEIESKENWDLFFKEIEHTRFSFLKNYTKQKIKEELQSKKMLDSLDVILKTTRIAQIEISISAAINNNSEPYLLLGAYQKALEIGDSLNAFACQSRLIYYLRRYQLTNNDITSIPVPSSRKFIAHLTNWVGLATNDDELFYTYKTREMAILYSKIDTNYLPLQFNYNIMALKYILTVGDTIMPIEQLEYRMKKCYNLKTSKDSMYVDYMLLNYNIMTAYNNNVIHRFEKIEKPLKEIKAYFERHSITETEAVKLGLLFNLYGKYNWTLEILYPLLKEYPNNNDVLFLFIQTYTSYNTNKLTETEYQKLLELAKKRDGKRYNDWVESTFQVLRIPAVKKEFCKLY